MIADDKGKTNFIFSPDESELVMENVLNNQFKATELVGNNSYNSFFTNGNIFTYLQSNKGSSVLTFKLSDQKAKLVKIKFLFDEKEIKLDLIEFVVHDNGSNVCFVGKSYLAFTTTDELLKQTEVSINIIHCSVVGTQKDFFKKFHFSRFDNTFGVLYSNNTFRLYNTLSWISQCVIDCDQNLVDFCFGTFNDIGFNPFTIFFMNERGVISYTCPIFPNTFKLPNNYLEIISNYITVKKNFETNSEMKEQYINYDSIIFNLKKSKGVNDIINSNNFLKSFSNKPSIDKMAIIDNRSDADKILENANFTKLYLMNTYPLTFLRISEINTIDIILCNDVILPLICENKIDGRIIDTIFFNTANKSGSIRIINENGDKLIISYLNDVYELDLFYIKNLSSYYKRYNGEDLSLNCKTKINSILNFDYSKCMPPTYYSCFMIDMTLFIITVLEKKFFVKMILAAPEKDEEKMLIVKQFDDKKSSKFENNILAFEEMLRK
jgi:hypothetical protein